MLFGADESNIPVKGSHVDYVVFGKGRKPLVLVPGLSLKAVRGSGRALAYAYRDFADEYRVYVFDSIADMPQNYTVRLMAEDLSLAMDAMNISDAMVLGVSQGGMVAQYLAIDHPEKVQKLVLAVTASRVNSSIESVIEAWTKKAERGDYRSIVADLMTKMYSEKYQRKYRALIPILMKVQKMREPRHFIALAKACLTVDCLGELDRIKCPVFVIGGKEDRITSAEAAEETAARLGCRIHMYEGLGHAAYDEAPDFNKRVLDFFRE